MKQLQAELRKLKEQLAQALASHVIDCVRDPAPGGPAVLMGKDDFLLILQTQTAPYSNNYHVFELEQIAYLLFVYTTVFPISLQLFSRFIHRDSSGCSL